MPEYDNPQEIADTSIGRLRSMDASLSAQDTVFGMAVSRVMAEADAPGAIRDRFQSALGAGR